MPIGLPSASSSSDVGAGDLICALGALQCPTGLSLQSGPSPSLTPSFCFSQSHHRLSTGEAISGGCPQVPGGQAHPHHLIKC